ncbi:MAG: hypothetical protein E7603_08725 [Ruminococcaceae bacterium]|nr:hypothetical protein [Oscillospiraceae bacterium]
MNLTVYSVKKLREVGFEFKQFENDCNIGKVYDYDGNIYTVGGKWGHSSYTSEEMEISQKGSWLPDESDLMKWLQLTHHDVQIAYSNETHYFHGEAKNEKGEMFTGGGPDLLCCLEKMIYKICKKSAVVPVPDQIMILDIE